MSSSEQPNQEPLPSRPPIGLRFMLCLSIVGSGVAALYNICMGSFLDHLSTAYQAGKLPVPDIFLVAFEDNLDIPRYCFILYGILSICSFVGALRMWKLNKSGFRLYTLSQLLIILVSLLFLGRANTQLGNIMMTLLFIFYYFFALRRLKILPDKKKNPSQEETTSQ